MRAGVLTALFAALLSCAPAGAGEPVQELLSPDEELRVADLAWRDGLHEVAAGQLRRLLETHKDFPERPRAELDLAKNDYLCGRRDEAEAHFRELLSRFRDGPLADGCAIWLGRLETEYRGEHGAAERRLRKLYERLSGAPGTLPALLTECRYYLALALVGRGEPRDIDGYDRAVPDGRGGEKTQRVPGAIELLGEIIRRADTAGGGELLAKAHVLRGRALLQLGRADECFELLQRRFLEAAAFASSPQRAEALFWQAEACFRRGLWEEAAELFAGAAEAASGPGAAGLIRRAQYGRGLALLGRAKGLRRIGLPVEDRLLVAAEASFEAVTGTADPGPAARLGAGEVLLLRGRCEAALQRLAGPAAERDEAGQPTLRAGEALLLSGRALAALNRHREAVARIGEAIRAAEAAGQGGGGLLVRAEAQRGENLFRMAEAARASDPAAAGRHLTAAAQAFRRAQLPPAGGPERCEASLWEARVLAAEQRFEEAGRILAELLESMPAREALGRDQLHCLRGEFLLERARRASDQTARGAAARAAVEQFGLARAVAPAGPQALRSTLGAAEAYRLLGNDPEANGLYEEVLAHPRAKEDPDRAHLAVLGIAEVLRAGGWHRRAVDLLRSRLLEATPRPVPRTRAKALRLLAGSLAVIEDPAGSARAWGELAQILDGTRDPAGAARARLDRALQLERAGDNSRAAAELGALAAACPADLCAEVQLQAGRAFEAKGDHYKALEFYHRAGGAQPEGLVAAAELELRTRRFESAKEDAEKAQKTAEGGSLLKVRAVLAWARAMAGLGKHQDAAVQFRYATDLAWRLRSSPEGRRAELEARRGLAAELSAMGRHADAASCYLQAAYIADAEKPAPELLELAAAALDRTGQARAAGEIRRLAGRRDRQ